MGIIAALLIGAAITAATSIGTQLISNSSVKKTNEANKDINTVNNAFNAQQAETDRQFQAAQAEETRTFNASEAEKQRLWQEEMSNTEIQRRQADLIAAGYNPMLAVTSGSASTPGAAVASSGMLGGSRAQASGFIPMRAQDFSPMAAMSSNLGHMVTSAYRMEQLQKIANNNPAIINNLAKVSSSMSKSVTRAAAVPSKASLMKEIEELSKLRMY